MNDLFLFNKWEKCRSNLLETQNDDKAIVYQGFYECKFGQTFLSADKLGHEALYIELSDESAAKFQNPSISGIHFEIVKNEALSTTKPYLAISLEAGQNLIEAFEAFTVTLTQQISLCPDPESALEIIYSVVDDYTSFFGHGGKDELGPKEEQGLFGELLVLRELLEHYGDGGVKTWTGPDKNKHDFIFASNDSIEVKTSTNQTRLDIKISNENQLSFEPGSLLFLKLLVVEKNPSGQTLVDLIYDIENSFLKTSETKKSFERKLLEMKVIPGKIVSRRRYTLVATHLYKVDYNFPRLTQATVHAVSNRIHEVKYRLSLDGMSEFTGDPYECLRIE